MSDVITLPVNSMVARLERQKANANYLMERRKAALRLETNPDFRKLVLEGFCREDAARYVHESADPSLPMENRQDALNMAQASGHLLRFLAVTVQMGAVAERDMEELDEQIVEARLEEDAA